MSSPPRRPGKTKAPRTGAKSVAGSAGATTCVNPHCKLRRAGCCGAEGCPGYKSRDDVPDKSLPLFGGM